MAKVFKSVTELIGKTPLLELENFRTANGAGAKIVAKLEYFNPAGSVKDRIALAMIVDAEQRGALKEGAVIIGADERQHGHRPCECGGGARLPRDFDHAGNDECGAAESAKSVRCGARAHRRQAGDEGCDCKSAGARGTDGGRVYSGAV